MNSNFTVGLLNVVYNNAMFLSGSDASCIEIIINDFIRADRMFNELDNIDYSNISDERLERLERKYNVASDIWANAFNKAKELTDKYDGCIRLWYKNNPSVRVSSLYNNN